MEFFWGDGGGGGEGQYTWIWNTRKLEVCDRFDTIIEPSVSFLLGFFFSPSFGPLVGFLFLNSNVNHILTI